MDDAALTRGLSRLALPAGLALGLLGSGAAAQTPATGTAPFVLDGNRVYAELSFIRPDGASHRALAFVDMGSPDMEMSSALFRELQIDRGRPLRFRVGGLVAEVPAKEVTSDPEDPVPMGSDLKVEAVLPAGVLQKYEFVLDYARRTITLGLPGTIASEGAAVPFRRNPRTGLIAVDARIGGASYPITIDSGSAYTWVRRETARGWLTANPGWQRGVGAVGASNMVMASWEAEARGILLRIPELEIGPVSLRSVGALGAGPGKGPGGADLFDWYSTKNAVPVIGWIGGNVLKAFRLTVDYANDRMYWLRQSEPDANDLDQVGLTLARRAGEYTVAAVATKNGRPTVEAVQPGDKLIRIDRLDTKHATKGAIYDALHGKPGEVRELVLERGGVRLTARATVTAF